MEPRRETPTDEVSSTSKGVTDGYATLKYQLLGPSLTKAGQDAVDQQKVRALASCIAQATTNLRSRYRKLYTTLLKDRNSLIMSKTATGF